MKHAAMGLAEWSEWVPLQEAHVRAPLWPGVYLVRSGSAGPVVYAGLAGVRSGKGLRGRIQKYSSGLASGLSEAALDRALADPVWLRARLAEVEDGRPMRAAEWAKAALKRAKVYMCWTVTTTAKEAEVLELQVIAALGAGLWNRDKQ
ncbi:hypothetical protein [Streptomyces sp. NPDC057580]|uniref:hypothetical protein n=1 Tax=Streptomyces sp. NPDC057580 TaxID=3346173 RepID=UPI003699ADF5